MIPVWRLAAFMSGLLAVWIAVGSPLVALDHQLLTIHMVKHLLLMAVASPLILLGTPELPLLTGIPKWGIPKWFRHDMQLRDWPTRRSPSSLSHLVFPWLAGTTTVIGWHLPAAFQLAIQSHWWHGVEQASFLLAGLLFWRPVVQSRSNGWYAWFVPLYLFLATLPCDVLSAFLAFCGRVVYPSYLAGPRLWDLSPLQDQEFAGALMWVSVTLIYLIPAVIITVQILSPSVQSGAKAVQT
jgi:cytochrome c oxidase assembly factor CtaG